MEKKGCLGHRIGREQARDTGLAMVLICLLFLLAGHRLWLIALAIGLLVVTMVRPQLFAPLARVWFGLSHLIGTVASRIVLTLIFFLIVTPVGLLRQRGGADPLQLKKWRRSAESVFSDRRQTFTAADLERPY